MKLHTISSPCYCIPILYSRSVFNCFDRCCVFLRWFVAQALVLHVCWNVFFATMHSSCLAVVCMNGKQMHPRTHDWLCFRVYWTTDSKLAVFTHSSTRWCRTYSGFFCSSLGIGIQLSLSLWSNPYLPTMMHPLSFCIAEAAKSLPFYHFFELSSGCSLCCTSQGFDSYLSDSSIRAPVTHLNPSRFAPTTTINTHLP